MNSNRLRSVAILALALTVFASGLVLPASVRAADPSPRPEGFEQRKTEILARIDERMKKMQEHRACVAAATDQDGLRKCREGMREFMEEKREEWRERRQEMREKSGRNRK